MTWSLINLYVAAGTSDTSDVLVAAKRSGVQQPRKSFSGGVAVPVLDKHYLNWDVYAIRDDDVEVGKASRTRLILEIVSVGATS